MRRGTSSIMRLRLGVIAVIALGLVFATASFLVTRQFQPAQRVEAEPPVTSLPPLDPETGEPRGYLWFIPALRADEAEPRFDGEVSGLRIGPDVERVLPSWLPCLTPNDLTRIVAPGIAAGALIDVVPDHLPVNARLEEEELMFCGDVPVTAMTTYTFPASSESSAWGGRVSIFRAVGGHQLPQQWAADRVHAAQIAGRPAVIVSPITSDGWGTAAIYLREPWGFTSIESTGLTTEELIQIANSLDVQVNLRVLVH